MLETFGYRSLNPTIHIKIPNDIQWIDSKAIRRPCPFGGFITHVDHLGIEPSTPTVQRSVVPLTYWPISAPGGP